MFGKRKKTKKNRKAWIRMIRDAKMKMCEEFIQEANHKTCWKAAKYGKMRHQTIIRGIRGSTEVLEMMEEGISREHRKVSFLEVEIREDIKVRLLEQKLGWLNQRVI